MTAAELIQLIFGLHPPDRMEERRAFVRPFAANRVAILLAHRPVEIVA
jgi:hypothetical protein